MFIQFFHEVDRNINHFFSFKFEILIFFGGCSQTDFKF